MNVSKASVCMNVRSCKQRGPLFFQSTVLEISEGSEIQSLGECSCYFIGPKLWNALPEHIKNAPTISHFNSGMKYHLF